MKKRAHKRWKMKERENRKQKIIRVLLKDGENSYPGIITNFSKTGMSIKTEHVLPTYKVIDICVKIGEKMVPLKGSVRWVNEISPPPGEVETQQNLIGVSLHNPPVEYLQHFE